MVIGNAARWAWIRDPFRRFNCQLIDEAFQLADYRFQQIAGMADRYVLVGDPGQIAPIIRSPVERRQSDPAGPHVACPRALTARYPGVRRLPLPVSRRLPPDTVSLVQTAFYPDLPFVAMSAPGERRMELDISGTTPLDRALNVVRDGASLVQVELPSMITGEIDEALADTIIGLIRRLLDRGARVRDGGQRQRLAPGMIGVVCAQVSQVEAVRERLPMALDGVFVETANRFQGLERPVMFVHHPLSGRRDGTNFHLDAGRLCVMLSRHRVACCIITRGGITDVLRRYTPSGARILGNDDDPEYEGWRAHPVIQEELGRRRWVVQLSGT